MLLPEAPAANVISCDVFDTLLHRDHRSERRRFNDIANLAARRLAAERRIVRHPGAIYDVRLEVQKQAYRALDLSCPTGDVRFADMVEAMGRLLSLDPQAAEILHQAEIATEIAQLRPNTTLFAWLADQARAGCRIIAVSDTYHRGETIAQLLAAHAPEHPVAHIYASADHNATKRTGALFTVVLRQEAVAGTDVLHIGDDTTADVTMARAAGLRTLQLLRPKHLVFRRRADALRARALHGLRIRAAHRHRADASA